MRYLFFLRILNNHNTPFYADFQEKRHIIRHFKKIQENPRWQ